MRAGQDLPTTPQCSVDRVKQSRKPLGPRFANATKLRQKCWREIKGWLRTWGDAALGHAPTAHDCVTLPRRAAVPRQ
jgi:hypothetical protein